MHAAARLSVAVAAGLLLAIAAAGSARLPAHAQGDDGTLRGVARHKGEPVADAEVAAGIIGCAPSAGDHVVTGRTDAEGRFALARAPLGPIDVWVRRKDKPWRFVIRMAHPGVNDLDVDPQWDPAVLRFGKDPAGGEKLSGVVTDRQGKAIAGAAVGLRGDDSTWVTTDAKGAFTLEGAAEGDGLVARARGFRDLVSEVKAGGKPLTLKLDAAKATVVRVTDPAGKPVSGAWVVLGDVEDVLGTTGLTALFPPRARLVGGWTDAKGETRIAWGHSEDATVATAHAPRHAPASKKVTVGKGPVTLQLTPAQPARATVVLRGSGEPLAGVLVGLPHESDGGPDSISALPEDAERGPIVVGRTDEKGRCDIPHLAAGVDTLRVVGEHKRDADVRIERLPPGEGR